MPDVFKLQESVTKRINNTDYARSVALFSIDEAHTLPSTIVEIRVAVRGRGPGDGLRAGVEVLFVFKIPHQLPPRTLYTIIDICFFFVFLVLVAAVLFKGVKVVLSFQQRIRGDHNLSDRQCSKYIQGGVP